MNPDYLRLPIKKTVTTSGFALLYFENCSAGGETHCDDIIEVIQRTGKKHYNHVHEWCCGHGAIGFELLSKGICQQLSLSDKFLPAVVGCEFTAAVNNVQDRVQAFQIEEFSSLPDSLKFDMIVANPPHFESVEQVGLPNLNDDAIRQVVDLNWESHRIFFDNASAYLNPGADVYLFEAWYGSRPDVFSEMINNSGLVMQGVHKLEKWPHQYIMHFLNKGIDQI